MNPEEKAEFQQDPIKTQEEADESTKRLGYKVFSTEELAMRQIESTKRRVGLFKKVLADVSSVEEMGMLEQMTEAELEKAFAGIINDAYRYAEENGLSQNDLKAVKKNILQLGILFERIEYTTDLFYGKLVYGITGENKFDDVPIRKVQDLVHAVSVAKE